MTAGEPSVIRARIESPKDLTMKVVRSNSATIRVSKLGISIHPGISAQGFITDVEGVLDRMQQILEAMIPHVSQKRRERAKMILANLKKARRGKFSFVLELKDPSAVAQLPEAIWQRSRKDLLRRRNLKNWDMFNECLTKNVHTDPIM